MDSCHFRLSFIAPLLSFVVSRVVCRAHIRLTVPGATRLLKVNAAMVAIQ